MSIPTAEEKLAASRVDAEQRRMEQTRREGALARLREAAKKDPVVADLLLVFREVLNKAD
jgi:hypothetical protein